MMHGPANFKLFDRFSKNTQISIFVNVRPVRSEGQTDGQTYMKLEVAFRNFANAPNKVRVREATDYNTIRRMRSACWMTKATNAMFNTYCFSGETVVTRTRLVTPLYANCLSCLK